MATKIGYLASNGHPHIKIGVWGLSEQFKQEFEAMIDTGFTGFLMMPLINAFPLALTLYGTTSYTLADGSSSPKLMAYGTVEVQGATTQGIIVLEANANCGPLVGMEFLRQFDYTMVLSKGGVWLIEPSELAATVGTEEAATEATPATPQDVDSDGPISPVSS
jgi:predicted aspartyl protease